LIDRILLSLRQLRWMIGINEYGAPALFSLANADYDPAAPYSQMGKL
jgi:hypothetical protein